MKVIGRRGVALLLAAMISGSAVPATAVNLDLGEMASVQRVSDWSQISELVQGYWQDTYFGEITIDPDTNQSEKDGEKISLRKQFDLSRTEEDALFRSSETAEQYFDEDTEYHAFTDAEGIVHVRDPYQTCRLIVYAEELAGDYGAVEVLHWAEYDEYILQFDSREATEAAYQKLTAELGEDSCFADRVLTADMLLSEGTGVTTKSCVSWGTAYMGLDILKEQAEEYGLTERDATVAIIDTGIDTDHPFFAERTVTGYNFITTDGSSSSDYEDTDVNTNGHGTHVAGIVTDATPDNVALMALRVFDSQGNTTDAAIEGAIRYAGKHGAAVVNMSLGALEDPEFPYSVWDRALKELYEKDIVVLAAAGNEGVNQDSLGYSMCYPATLDTTIAISALSKVGTLASYSSFGDAVDFAAPGSDIVSAAVGGGTRTDSGTSMATPEMAGAVTYIKLLHPEYTVTEVYETLRAYTEDLGEPGKDDQYGYGSVHMEDYLDEDSNGKNLGVPGTAVLELKYSRMSYTGKARKNPVQVYLKKTGELLDSSNYTVSYSNNKKIGMATVTVTGRNGYSGSISAEFPIIPQGMSISKLTSTGNRSLKVQWNAISNCRGYQIEYATNSSFRNAKRIIVVGNTKKSRTITKLTKGKKYYVRLRSYKIVNGVSYRGRWSVVKTKTVK